MLVTRPAHVAIVTGANHGIGAAVAAALASRGIAVLASYLRMAAAPDPGIPDLYRQQRAADVTAVAARIRASGGSIAVVEADLADAATAPMLFDTAEREFGAVDVLVNNASAWLADTFKTAAADRFGRSLQPVTAQTFDRQFAVDARATALLIAEFPGRRERVVDQGGLGTRPAGGDRERGGAARHRHRLGHRRGVPCGRR